MKIVNYIKLIPLFILLPILLILFPIFYIIIRLSPTNDNKKEEEFIDGVIDETRGKRIPGNLYFNEKTGDFEQFIDQ